jgi:hypothetical protein
LRLDRDIPPAIRVRQPQWCGAGRAVTTASQASVYKEYLPENANLQSRGELTDAEYEQAR